MSARRPILGVIFGGRSGEHEVSLMSARSILGAIDRDKYDVVSIGISKEGRWYAGENVLDALETGQLEGLEPVTIIPEPGPPILYRIVAEDRLEAIVELDILFPVLHGTFGEDGTLQGLLEVAEIPYVGAGVLASAVAMDKALFKSLMRSEGIPVLDWMVANSVDLERDADGVLDRAEAMAGYPLFTKPANLGSSVGITKCRSRSDLYEGVLDAAQYDRRILIERGIEAREIEVSVLGNEDPEASIPGEVRPGDEFYSYRAKYIDDSSELLIPAPIDDELAESAKQMARQAFQAIDGAGMGRVDFLLETSSGRLYLNEINTIPGFTQISMYPKLWEASGLPYPRLIDRLVELGQQRHGQRQRLQRSYGGAG